MTVAAILHEKGSDVHTLSSAQTLTDAVSQLAENGVGALVVTDAHLHIEGILSERDIVRAVGRHGAKALDNSVASVMTRDVKTCSEDTTTQELMSLMTKGRFRHMPVAREGKLIGIISIGDVVKKRIADIEQEAEDIKAYIAAV